jgi:membrane protein implicated in regulation of membrane protease activity
MVPPPLIWFLVGLALLAVEWLGAEFDGVLAGALAALGVSVLTALLPGLMAGGQVLLFAAGTGGLLLLLQRWSLRRERAIPASGSREHATVISGFAPASAEGRVRWQGQSWAATNLEPEQTLTPGEAVVVMGRDGNQLQVLRGNLKPSEQER